MCLVDASTQAASTALWQALVPLAVGVPGLLVALGLYRVARVLQRVVYELRGQNNLTQILMGRQQAKRATWGDEGSYSH